MSNIRKLGRAESVISGGTPIPPGRQQPSGICTGDSPSPCQSPVRFPQPRSAAGTGSSVERVEDTPISFSSVNSHGTTQPKGKRPGKAKRDPTSIKPGAGAVPKKGRAAKGDSPEITVPAPGPFTAQLQPEEPHLQGSARRGPPGKAKRDPTSKTPTAGAVTRKGRSAKRDSGPEFTGPAPSVYAAQLQPEEPHLQGSARRGPPDTPVQTTVIRDGLIYGLLDRAAPAYASALGALSTGQSGQGTEQSTLGFPGLARSEGPASTSSYPRCSGIPVTQVSSGISSATSRGRTSKKKAKKGRRSRRSTSSSSGSASHSARGKRRRHDDSISRAEFLDVFQTLAASLSGRREELQRDPPVAARHIGHGWVASAAQGELPHTVSRAPESPPAISLHPSMLLESDPDSVPERQAVAPPPTLGGFLSPGTSQPPRSDESAEVEDELASFQRLSVPETELRLVQRDMIRVLNLPPAADPTPSERPLRRNAHRSKRNRAYLPESPKPFP